ncbi:MAG: hypothetical protein KGJ23_14890 [Euryarchaeota archaeon]|nr:hypothetical protein [Euryarchaeota archaeon]MDE1837886.1 hypothetical protein [Euryarchaeota archaeon]MDE2046232.1 hypothetical protein [Thermoplasmata archaeon]
MPGQATQRQLTVMVPVMNPGVDIGPLPQGAMQVHVSVSAWSKTVVKVTSVGVPPAPLATGMGTFSGVEYRVLRRSEFRRWI